MLGLESLAYFRGCGGEQFACLASDIEHAVAASACLEREKEVSPSASS